MRSQAADSRSGPIRCKANESVHVEGEFCCDGELDSLLRQVRKNSKSKLGDIARRVQRRSQWLHNHAFEIIISEHDFVVNSYYHGQHICKIKTGGFNILAYQTPRERYNLSDTDQEKWLASIDSQEPLGSTLHIEREEWSDIREDELADLLAGTHCKRDRRDGQKCCSREIFYLMKNVVEEAATSPVFNTSNEAPGVVANVIRKRVQQRFARIFEVVVSKDDFVQATYTIGDFTCKFAKHGLYMLAFETPHQTGYHPYDKVEVAHFAGISDSEPLGTPNYTLPGQVDLNKGIELETDGYRIGFPRDSHCDHERKGGSKCCHMGLFMSMHDSVMEMKAEDTFNDIDRRIIAQKMRKQAEEAIGEPLEMIIADEDFVVSSQIDKDKGDCICKFKADQYHIMAWRTPGNYAIGHDQFADNGHTSFVGCKKNTTQLDGATCCNQTLRYTITKTLHESSKLDFTSMDTMHVTRALQKAAQGQFNARVETVVSRGNFIWNSPMKRMMKSTCKLDLFQYHALIFQTDVHPRALLPDEEEGFEEFERPLDFKPGEGGGTGTGGSAGNGGTGNGQGQGSLSSNGNGNSNSNANLNSNANTGESQSDDRNVAAAAIVESQVQQPLAGNPVFRQAVAIGNQAAEQQIAEAVRAVVTVGQGARAMVPPLFGGGFACFTEEVTVMTPDGEKTMKELQIGEYILTANGPEVYFAPVTTWLHKDLDDETGYHHIATETGRKLVISPKHLIYRTQCNGNNSDIITRIPDSGEIYAYMIAKGDCFYIYEEETWRVEKIVSTQLIRRKGAYAPLTPNGRLFVNGILASCYSVHNEQTIINTYMEVVANLQNNFHWLFDWFSSNQHGLPYFLSLYDELLHMVIPNTFYYKEDKIYWESDLAKNKSK